MVRSRNLARMRVQGESSPSRSREIARSVLETEAQAVSALIPRIDHRFGQAIELLFSCTGRVVLTGMGKSGIIGRKIAATLSSTGTPALFLHPADAIHGDLGMLAERDLVLAVSNSGETQELVRLVPTLKRLGVHVIGLVGELESTLAKISDVVLNVSVDREACALGLAPTASTTAALALGDALAVALSERKGLGPRDFARLHPGGRLGDNLILVSDLMRRGDEVPKATPSTPMKDVIGEISRKGLGIAGIVAERDRLVGVISDGDLRRMLQSRGEPILHCTAAECMTRNPVTIGGDQLATKALNLMERMKIMSLLVPDAGGRLVGIIHIHDLWRTEMVG
ncbi:MAG: KpsF/GutQ family sugar-phosphate isomerase [Acidobacteriota bacterium]|nr:KpsF/GutQ family sugar-phosphate isomerase [Acidobacteriota bacterium]